MGKLTAAAVRGLHTEGKYLDGAGLVLVVRSAGRHWQYRFQRGGRERVMSLGSVDDVTLAEARKLHAEARALLLAGKDPLEERARTRLDLTRRFTDVAAAYIADHEPRWSSRRNAQQWRNSLRDYAYPVIGKVAVSEIDIHHVLKVLRPIWTAKPVTARYVRSRLEAIIDYAGAMGWRTGPNPAIWRGGLKSLLPATSALHTTTHHAAKDWRECPAFMVELREHDGMGARALQFAILTAARSAEVRGAVWSEIDLDRAIWTIPASRMKTRREHRVPLNKASLDLLRTLAEIRSSDLVFPGRSGSRPLADMTIGDQLRQLGHAEVTVHGFRSSFRDWAADTGRPSDLAEAALAHVSGNAVVRAYQRSDLLEARRSLMQQWADFLSDSVVIPLRATA